LRKGYEFPTFTLGLWYKRKSYLPSWWQKSDLIFSLISCLCLLLPRTPFFIYVKALFFFFWRIVEVLASKVMAMVAAAKMMIGILCKGFEFHFNGIDEIIHIIPSDYQQPAVWWVFTVYPITYTNLAHVPLLWSIILYMFLLIPGICILGLKMTHLPDLHSYNYKKLKQLTRGVKNWGLIVQYLFRFVKKNEFFFRYLPQKQEFMLDTHLMKASCEDCGAACGHFRLLDWALANQLILDWAYCEDYSFASNLINLNFFSCFFYWVLLFSIW